MKFFTKDTDPRFAKKYLNKMTGNKEDLSPERGLGLCVAISIFLILVIYAPSLIQYFGRMW